MKPYTSPAEAYDAARRCLQNKQMPEAETILRELASRYPDNLRYGEAALEAVFRQGKTEEALDLFRALVGRFDPTGDSVYDTLYVDAIRVTATSPLPLRRMLRFYELVKQLQRTLPLTGEVVECGCFRGLSSYLMCNYLRRHDSGFTGKGYHIFDSFQGLSVPTTEDEIPEDHANAKNLKDMTRTGAFAASFKHVKDNLKAFPDIEFHPGWIPLTFGGVPERTYKFAHIDVDLYDPTLNCLEYFYPRLVAGGALVSDDYGWPGAQQAMEEFCAERKIAFDVTNYRQAVIVKS